MGGADDELLKVVGAEKAGAGAADEEAAALHELEGEGVQVTVFKDTFFLVVAVMDELWGIKDDGVPELAVFDHLA
jgi:hypothetical protein